MREAKFNFIPAHQVESTFDGGQWKVTVAQKPAKQISFSVRHTESLALEGKYLQFYVDQAKNSIAWKVLEKGSIEDVKTAIPVRTYKTINKKNGSESKTMSVSISQALNALETEKGKTYSGIVVKKYRQQGYLNDGRDFYYIEIPRPGKAA